MYDLCVVCCVICVLGEYYIGKKMLNTRVWCENKLFEEFWVNSPELNEKKKFLTVAPVLNMNRLWL